MSTKARNQGSGSRFDILHTVGDGDDTTGDDEAALINKPLTDECADTNLLPSTTSSQHTTHREFANPVFDPSIKSTFAQNSKIVSKGGETLVGDHQFTVKPSEKQKMLGKKLKYHVNGGTSIKAGHPAKSS
ncbi:hypothetical protein M5689_013430 [Euphorbia peplus]|nr:hypothetical protein M5689_013430 [Euphorbia peplus]